MGNTLGDAGANIAGQAKDTAGKLLDSQGRMIERAGKSTTGLLEEVGSHIREQPFSAMFIALGIGYIIGRLRLL